MINHRQWFVSYFHEDDKTMRADVLSTIVFKFSKQVWLIFRLRQSTPSMSRKIMFNSIEFKTKETENATYCHSSLQFIICRFFIGRYKHDIMCLHFFLSLTSYSSSVDIYWDHKVFYFVMEWKQQKITGRFLKYKLKNEY